MKVFVAVCFCTLLTGCAVDSDFTDELPPKEAVTDTTTSVVRQPVGPALSAAVPAGQRGSLIFADSLHDFGSVRQGHTVRHRFQFTNQGEAPLLILDARSSCGCTVTQFPDRPVEPGQSGVVSVAFNTTHRSGTQHKPVALIIENQAQPTVVYLRGTILN